MRQDIKERWLAKLREPDRIQGHKRLRIELGDGRVAQCCLDLLCEVAVEDGILDPPTHHEGRGWGYRWPIQEFESATERLELPNPVWVWAKLDSGNPPVTMDNGVQTSLAELNDGSQPWLNKGVGKHTFEEIADIIEEKF